MFISVNRRFHFSLFNGRPITSYAALDLPTYFMDLTPFVPILADGDVHSVTIDVSSAESNHTINSNWIVSGNIQVYPVYPDLLMRYGKAISLTMHSPPRLS